MPFFQVTLLIQQNKPGWFRPSKSTRRETVKVEATDEMEARQRAKTEITGNDIDSIVISEVIPVGPPRTYKVAVDATLFKEVDEYRYYLKPFKYSGIYEIVADSALGAKRGAMATQLKEVTGKGILAEQEATIISTV